MKDPLQPELCARLLKALAEPERLRIVRLLRNGPKNVGELAGLLDTLIVNVSHHLHVLRNAGIVDHERQGRFVIYRLKPDVFQPNDSAEVIEFLDLGCCRLEMPKLK